MQHLQSSELKSPLDHHFLIAALSAMQTNLSKARLVLDQTLVSKITGLFKTGTWKHNQIKGICMLQWCCFLEASSTTLYQQNLIELATSINDALISTRKYWFENFCKDNQMFELLRKLVSIYRNEDASNDQLGLDLKKFGLDTLEYVPV
jgi:hypothetical protein